MFKKHVKMKHIMITQEGQNNHLSIMHTVKEIGLSWTTCILILHWVFILSAEIYKYIYTADTQINKIIKYK